MGVQDLTKEVLRRCVAAAGRGAGASLEPVITPCGPGLERWRGMRAAVEVSNLAHRFLYASDGTPEALVRRAATFRSALCHALIRPVWVFDGPPAAAKFETLRRRSAARAAAEARFALGAAARRALSTLTATAPSVGQKRPRAAAVEAEAAAAAAGAAATHTTCPDPLDAVEAADVREEGAPRPAPELDSGDALTALREAAKKGGAHPPPRPTSAHMTALREYLAGEGDAVVQAAHDAEVECCRLAITGEVHVVFSSDSDCLPLGAPLLVTDVMLPTAAEVRLDRVLAGLASHPSLAKTPGLPSPAPLELLRDLCLLCGTDFNDRIEGVGPITALRWLAQFGSLDAALAAVAAGDGRATVRNPASVEAFRAALPDARAFLRSAEVPRASDPTALSPAPDVALV